MNSLFLGNFKAAFSGRGIEFQDFREYSPWDDAKYIDWVTSSREGTTIMRRYREEKEGTILYILDTNEQILRNEDTTKKNLLYSVVELIGVSSMMTHELFWGYILEEGTQKYIEPKKSYTALYNVLWYSPTIPRSTENLMSIDFLMRKSLKKSIIFIISDRLEIDTKSFKIAALKHDIVYIHISSVFENTLNKQGIVSLRWSLFSRGIDLDDEIKKETYQELRKNKIKNFQKSLYKIGIHSISIDESSSVYAEFLTLMKRRENWY